MATISSLGIGSGLDIKNIVSQLVAIEKQPLEKLKLQAAATQTKISTHGQIKSLVSTLSDAAGKLTSLTGWNAVAATSSDKNFVTASAIGGTQPTTFSVEVQALAKAQATASAAITPANNPVGAGTLQLTVGSGTPVDITISATDTVADVAGKINGANAGVAATLLNDGGGVRLLLQSKATGVSNAFTLTVTSDADGNTADAAGLSRLVVGSTVTQAAADAAATINGIAVTSSSNTFADKVPGVTFTAVKETTAPVTVTVARDTSAVQQNIEAFVKAYNDLNTLINEATKYDPATKTGGLLQGDATTLTLQSALRAAAQSLRTGSAVFGRLSDIGLAVQRGGNLEINSGKLSSAMEQMDELKALFSSNDPGSGQGIAVRIKNLTTTLLASDGFFKSKDDAFKRALDSNAKEQARVNDKAARVEAELTRRYSALDAQLTKLNGLNNYLTQQITQWNKNTS